MPIFPLLLLPMLIHQQDLLTFLSHATTRETSPSVSCGGFWPVRFCVFVVQFLVNCHGMLCPICSSTAIPRRPKRKNKLAVKLSLPLKLPASKFLMTGLTKPPLPLHQVPISQAAVGQPRHLLLPPLLILVTNGVVPATGTKAFI